MLEDLKISLNKNYPVVAALMSIIFGLASLLITLKDYIPLLYIILASFLGAILITVILVFVLQKLLLVRSNPDYRTISSYDTLEILDPSGKYCTYSRKLSIELKRRLNSFYIYLPRVTGKIQNVKCYISENKDFSGSKEIEITIHNYLDRNAAFIYTPFSKKDRKYIEFKWDLANSFEDKIDSFAVYPEPNQQSCILKIISPRILAANWLVYHAENLRPYHSGSNTVFGTKDKGTAEFEFAPYLKKVYYKCSLSWERE